MGLTPKQNKFIDKYLESGIATKAALESYNTSDYNTAHAIGSQNLHKLTIRKGIEEKISMGINSKGLTKDYIIDNIIGIAEGKSKGGGRVKPQDELKANELLGRSIGVFKDVQDIRITATVPKSIAELDAEYRTLIDNTEVKTLAPHDISISNPIPEGTGGGEPEPLSDSEHG